MEKVALAYAQKFSELDHKTNFDRIKAMNVDEFVMFLKNCKFDTNMPVIEGRRFYTEDELKHWFEEVPA